MPPSHTPPTPLFLVGTQEDLLRLSFPYFTSAFTSPLHEASALHNLTFITPVGHISFSSNSITTSSSLFRLSLLIEASSGVAVAIAVTVVPSFSSPYPNNDNPGGPPPVLLPPPTFLDSDTDPDPKPTLLRLGEYTKNQTLLFSVTGSKGLVALYSSSIFTQYDTYLNLATSRMRHE